VTGKEAPRDRREQIAVPGVNVLRWELGNALRELRLAAGLTVAQAAAALECSDAKISRLENGQRGAIARDVRDLCQLYGVPDDHREELMAMSREARTIDRSNSTTIPAKFSTYLALETTAVRLRTFESTLVPGLLQTERYARHIIVDTGDLSESDNEDRIKIRLERQRRLTSRFRPLRAHFVIDENVLWRPLGDGPEAAFAREEQLDRLVWASRLPNVTIQVMPYDAGLYPGMEAASIILLDFEEGTKQSTVCYLEGILTELFLRGQNEIESIAQKFDRMREQALDPARSRALLMRVAGGRYRHWSMR
jgi:transcriptional regulator with XRE-family HTH domain